MIYRQLFAPVGTTRPETCSYTYVCYLLWEQCKISNDANQRRCCNFCFTCLRKCDVLGFLKRWHGVVVNRWHDWSAWEPIRILSCCTLRGREWPPLQRDDLQLDYSARICQLWGRATPLHISQSAAHCESVGRVSRRCTSNRQSFDSSGARHRRSSDNYY